MKVSEVIRAVEHAGCTLLRQRGSHRVYLAPNGRVFVMPYHSQTQETCMWYVQRQLRGTEVNLDGDSAVAKNAVQVRAGGAGTPGNGQAAPAPAGQDAPGLPQRAPAGAQGGVVPGSAAGVTKACPRCRGRQPLYPRAVPAGTRAQAYGMQHYFAVETTAGYCARCRNHYPI